MMDAEFDVSWLLAPTTVDEFERNFRERQPLHVERGRPDYYAELMTLDDFDRLLALSGPDFGQIRIVHSGRQDPVEEDAGLGAVYDAFEAGATLQVRHVDARWEPWQRLTHVLARWAGAEVWVNSYLTPGGNAQGFSPHHDRHDVLIAQIHGTKRWRLYGVRSTLPFEGRMFSEKFPGAAKFEREIVLNAGDLLYLPRGTIHAATSEAVTSLHCTIAVEPVLWATAIQDGIRRIFEQDVAFRKALPPGLADDPGTREQAAETMHDLLRELWQQLSPPDLIEKAAHSVEALHKPTPRGRLTGFTEAEHAR